MQAVLISVLILLKVMLRVSGTLVMAWRLGAGGDDPC